MGQRLVMQLSLLHPFGVDAIMKEVPSGKLIIDKEER